MRFNLRHCLVVGTATCLILAVFRRVIGEVLFNIDSNFWHGFSECLRPLLWLAGAESWAAEFDISRVGASHFLGFCAAMCVYMAMGWLVTMAAIWAWCWASAENEG